MKKYLKNKKGSSMMEYFILTVVALLIGAAVFTMGKSVKGGVDKGTAIVDKINSRLDKPVGD